MAGMSKRSLDLCQDSTLNKSTAFTEAEKDETPAGLNFNSTPPRNHRKLRLYKLRPAPCSPWVA